MDKILIQPDDFDLTTEVKLAKANNSSIGAVVSFVGTVRDLQPKSLSSMTLEHYPGTVSYTHLTLPTNREV